MASCKGAGLHNFLPRQTEPQVSETPTADFYPVTLAPGLSRLFVDFTASNPSVRAFYGSLPQPDASPRAASIAAAGRPPLPSHWPELVRLLAAQNSAPAAGPALAALAQGAGIVATGQQVGALRRSAVHALQGRHRHCPRPPGHCVRQAPRGDLLAGERRPRLCRDRPRHLPCRPRTGQARLFPRSRIGRAGGRHGARRLDSAPLDRAPEIAGHVRSRGSARCRLPARPHLCPGLRRRSTRRSSPPRAC